MGRMTSLAVRTLSATLLLSLSTLAVAQTAEPTLTVGDKAPAFSVGEFVKGESVAKFEPGTVYVLECWATWCGPCIQAIPHVTSLQKKYEGKVVVIGVNVWERDEALVKPFIEKMGDKMEYRVAMDNKKEIEKGHFATHWLDAAGQNGIPCTFIVNQEGKVAWIGHPMEMDKPLEEIVSGTYDINSAATEFKARKAEQAAMAEAQKAIRDSVKQGKEAHFAEIDAQAAKYEQIARSADLLKFQALAMSFKDYDAANAFAEEIYERNADNLNTIANVAVAYGRFPNDKRNPDLALKYAAKADEMLKGKNLAIAVALASAQHAKGLVDEAIETQTRALSLAQNDQQRTMLNRILEQYKASKK